MKKFILASIVFAIAFTMKTSAQLSASMSIVPVACKGNNTGTATVNVSGQTGAAYYLWSNGSTNVSRYNLYAGVYTVTVTDDIGSVTASGIVTEPIYGILLTGTYSKPKCYGMSNANASVTISGGTPPYSYLWSNGQTNSTATGLSAGLYSCSVSDASCYRVMNFTITNPVALTVNSTLVTNPTNALPNSGAITVAASGGTPNYLYLWNTSPIKTTASVTGLHAGTYTVKTTDKNGCTATKSVVLVQSARMGNFDQLDLGIYPNPNDGNFTLRCNSFNNTSTVVEIFDNTQRLVESSVLLIKKGESEKIFSCNKLTKGFYYLRYNDKAITKTIKFVVN